MTWRRSTKPWISWVKQINAAFAITNALLRLNKRRGIVKLGLVFLTAYWITLKNSIPYHMNGFREDLSRVPQLTCIWIPGASGLGNLTRRSEWSDVNALKKWSQVCWKRLIEAWTYLCNRKYSIAWAFVPNMMSCHFIGRYNLNVVWSMATPLWKQLHCRVVYWKW